MSTDTDPPDRDPMRTDRGSTSTPTPGYQPGCRNQQCQCQTPGPVCDHFMGLHPDRPCPHCGWGLDHHTNREDTPDVTDRE